MGWTIDSTQWVGIPATAEALEYSREGHWVVVLCQRGRTEGERAKVREALLAAGGTEA